MSRYPDDPRPQAPTLFRNNRPTISGGPEWAQQSRGLTRFGLGEQEFSYKYLTLVEAMTLHAYYESVNGAAGRFTFVTFIGIDDGGLAWPGLFVVQGDGVDDGPWDLPTYAIQQSMTSVSASLTAGVVVVTPASMTNIVVGGALTAVNADGTSGEVVTVTATTATTFTATFASNKAANWLVNAPLIFADGVAKTTVWNTATPAAGTYGTKVGTGTDGVDSLYAGTAPGAGVIVSAYALCRRAFRKAKFLNVKNPFSFDAPDINDCGPVTIIEMRK